MQLQAYLDHARRKDLVLFAPDANIADIEYQQRARLRGHRLVWGAGYRHSRDDVDPGTILTFIPEQRSLTWLNTFVQDEIALSERVELTLGTKFERNTYTGWETLPSARLSWRPAPDRLAWAAVSRAVRVPARLDRDVFIALSPQFAIRGGPDFQSEVAIVSEFGWRARLAERLSFSITAFRQDWDRLRSATVPGTVNNNVEGFTAGVEVWGAWQVSRSWRLSAGATTLHEKLRLKPGSLDALGASDSNLANDAEYQWMVHSSHTWGERFELDLRARRVGALPNPPVPAYTALDARLGMRVSRNVDVALSVRNAADARHVEFGTAANASVVERSYLASLTWRF
jgi:iron complex outermembrane receptor protein